MGVGTPAPTRAIPARVTAPVTPIPEFPK